MSMTQAEKWARAAAGGILGFLGGTDGGGTPPISNQPPVRTEKVPLDRADQASFDATKQGMSTSTMMMLGGGALLLVAVLVMGRK